MVRLRTAFALAVLCIAATGFAKLNPKYLPTDFADFDSAHAIGLEATINDARILTEADEQSDILDEVQTQMFYLVGALNHYNSVGDLAHAKITIKSVKPVAEGRNEVKYSAKFTVGWAGTGKAFPLNMNIPVPNDVSAKGMKQFYNAYYKTCSLSPDDEDMDADSFYYYYRPHQKGCSLNAKPWYATKAAYAFNFTLQFANSPNVTQNKSPEYKKVWEDGKLQATLIFGTYVDGATADSDYGIASFNSTYQFIRKQFGDPKSMNVQLGATDNPGIKNPDIEMNFVVNDKPFNIALFLIGKSSLQNVSEAFKKRYNERTEHSDFIGYNGHAGYGDNIRALAKMGNFQKDQYQVFYINGCDTFAYVADDLAVAHQKVNPGAGLYKHFDVITNAMPSHFGYSMTKSNLAVVDAMLTSTGTYASILSKFDVAQRAIVLGEEDND